jgi:hypothetical protein
MPLSSKSRSLTRGRPGPFWRFGVECFYRLLRQVKVLTNSRNPVLRFLGLVMQNLWVHLRWLCTRRPSMGRHKLIPTLLRFDRFRKLLIRTIEVFFRLCERFWFMLYPICDSLIVP